jgi:hypothetical protein
MGGDFVHTRTRKREIQLTDIVNTKTSRGNLSTKQELWYMKEIRNTSLGRHSECANGNKLPNMKRCSISLVTGEMHIKTIPQKLYLSD